jgi:Flp pilus assembly protein TadG
MRSLSQCEVRPALEHGEQSRNRVAALLSFWHDERGVMLVETAASVIVLMALVLGIMEFSYMAFNYSVLEESAREGVRYASVHGTDNATSCSGPSTGCDSTAANVVSDVKAYAAGFSGKFANMNVTVSYPDGVSTGTSRVQVTVSQLYEPVFYRVITAPTITVSSTGRILY